MELVELFDNTGPDSGVRFPYKVESMTQILVTSGSVTCIVDFIHYSVEAPSMGLFFPNQIISEVQVSGDFKCLGMLLSHDFLTDFDLPVSFHDRMAFQKNHFFRLSQEMLESYLSCYNQVSGILHQADNPYREKILKHLFSAYYYGLGYYVHRIFENAPAMNRRQELCANYLTLVSIHSKEYRGIGFYADKLCVSEKYLSTMLKAETGRTALEWIEASVVLYAKSCLVSSSMTIQEISNDLNFPSQSVFGKYFKRVTGMSPKKYRESIRKPPSSH